MITFVICRRIIYPIYLVQISIKKLFQEKNTSIFLPVLWLYQWATVIPASTKSWLIKPRSFGIRHKSTGTRESMPMQSNWPTHCPRAWIVVSLLIWPTKSSFQKWVDFLIVYDRFLKEHRDYYNSHSSYQIGETKRSFESCNSIQGGWLGRKNFQVFRIMSPKGYLVFQVLGNSLFT